MCIFCKIAAGEIPSYKIYEDDSFLAFLDISQATIGHTLVIPKKHFENIFELDEETTSKMLVVVKNVANMLKKSLNITDINILNNNGPLAGQSVFHFHIHLIPRYENDDVNFITLSHENDINYFTDLVNKIKM